MYMYSEYNDDKNLDVCSVIKRININYSVSF